jgi:diaminopimelate decarboxylase
MFLTPAKAAEVRERFGTPCYVYDRASLDDAARQALAFPNAFGLTVRYAMKANPNAAILRRFLALGLHVDASSDHEVERALGRRPNASSSPRRCRREIYARSWSGGSSTMPARSISSTSTAAPFPAPRSRSA